MADNTECPIKETSEEGFKKPEIVPTNSNSKSPEKLKKQPRLNISLPYKEPEWSGIPPPLYYFEIIKNGTLVETIKITSSLIVFGRLDVCEVTLEHPSVSRFHAVVQFCKGDDTHPRGFYLYDLKSTHGTFLNKKQIEPNVYHKLKVGYMLKFGGSTRLHFFQGPDEENNEKSENSVCKSNEEVCDWGIGEDAEEEEDLNENPFALSAPNEELYIEDPKKTLRGWFEREGYELEYKVEEKGFKTFSCRIQLPIDNPNGEFMSVEASVSGKKKEAVIACALEACRTLDRLGMLRQSHHESHERKKKKWEENDYYDSDEDIFFDRTGTIEQKREMRKRAEKKPEAETYESLQAKFKGVLEEIEEIKNKLSTGAMTQNAALSGNDVDSLDAYMSSLTESSNAVTNKIERAKLKVRLAEAEKEKLHLEKMLDIAKPIILPQKRVHSNIIGKRLKSKLQLPPSSSEQSKPQSNLQESEEFEEENDDEEHNFLKENTKIDNDDNLESLNRFSKEITNTSKNIENNPTEHIFGATDQVSKDKNYGLMTKIEYENKKAEIEENIGSETSVLPATDQILHNTSKRTLGPEKPNLDKSKNNTKHSSSKRSKQVTKSKSPNADVYMIETSEYSNWVPPSNQSGDGITHLNEKYGY